MRISYNIDVFTHTRSMEVAFYIIFGVIVLLVIDIRITLVFDYNIYDNIGHINIKLFGITCFSGEVSLVSEYFKLVHGKKKVVQINLLTINKETIKLIEDISSLFIKRINLVNLVLYCKMYGDDPYAVAMTSGGIRVSFGLILTRLQAQYPYSYLNNIIDTSFFGSEFSLGLSGKIFINIYDFIWAIARAIYIRRFGSYGEKRDGYERRKRKYNY